MEQILERSERVAITGPPRCGKSALLDGVRDRPVLSTDRFRQTPWSEIPAEVLRWCRGRTHWVVEGCQVARALRRGLWCSAVLWLDRPLSTLDRGQKTMAKTVHKVFNDFLRQRMELVPEVPALYFLVRRLGGVVEFRREDDATRAPLDLRSPARRGEIGGEDE